MYIHVNIHWGYTLCYIFWRLLYTLGDSIYIGVHVGFCYFLLPNVYTVYTLGHKNIHWDTWYTLDDINIHWVCTLCYNDNTHIHWVTLGIYIVVHYTHFRSCYTMYITMFPNVYVLLGYIYILMHWVHALYYI